MIEVLRVRVAGTPVPQGSMSAFPIRRKNGSLGATVTDQKGKSLKPWREAVRSTVVDRLGDSWQPVIGPVHVLLTFALPKPSSAPKTRRTFPIGRRADLDKLARAVLDALTDAGLWLDDGQVIELRARKDYPGERVEQMTPGVLISVYRIEQNGPPAPVERSTLEGLTA